MNKVTWKETDQGDVYVILIILYYYNNAIIEKKVFSQTLV